MLGLPPERLVGRVIWDAYPEARDTLMGDGLRRARAEGVLVTVPDQMTTLGRWAEIRVYPLPSGVLYVHFTDRTEQHLAQERAAHLADLAAACRVRSLPGM
jgi:hypothetical protein